MGSTPFVDLFDGEVPAAPDQVGEEPERSDNEPCITQLERKQVTGDRAARRSSHDEVPLSTRRHDHLDILHGAQGTNRPHVRAASERRDSHVAASSGLMTFDRDNPRRAAHSVLNLCQKAFTRLDTIVYRLTDKSIGGRIAHAPTLLLATTGARSGKRRTTPLVYVREGNDLLVVAAYGGSPWNPYWYTNLLAHPRATVDLEGTTLEVEATLVTGQGRARLWPKMRQEIASLPSAERRTSRQIPLVRLRS